MLVEATQHSKAIIFQLKKNKTKLRLYPFAEMKDLCVYRGEIHE